MKFELARVLMFSERAELLVDRVKVPHNTMSPLDDCQSSPPSADSCDENLVDMMRQRASPANGMTSKF